MQNISNYNKLIKNTETIIIKIKSLEGNFEKNKNELAILNSTLTMLLSEISNILDTKQY
jgi:hypothetical protein